MSLPKRHAFSAWAGLLGGALSVAEGILILSKPGYYDYDSPLDYLVLVVEGAALLVLLAALSGLHARLATGYGRTGTAGFSRPSPGPPWPAPGTSARSRSSTSSTPAGWCTRCSL